MSHISQEHCLVSSITKWDPPCGRGFESSWVPRNGGWAYNGDQHNTTRCTDIASHRSTALRIAFLTAIRHFLCGCVRVRGARDRSRVIHPETAIMKGT